MEIDLKKIIKFTRYLWSGSTSLGNINTTSIWWDTVWLFLAEYGLKFVVSLSQSGRLTDLVKYKKLCKYLKISSSLQKNLPVQNKRDDYSNMIKNSQINFSINFSLKCKVSISTVPALVKYFE